MSKQRIQHHAMSLFDFSADDLACNQSQRLSPQQKKLLYALTWKQLPVDLALSFLLFGLFIPAFIFSRFAPEIRWGVASAVLVFILAIPLNNLRLRRQAIATNELSELIYPIRAGSYAAKNRVHLRIARRRFKPTKERSEVQELKGLFHIYYFKRLNYLLSVNHLGDDSVENRARQFAEPQFVQTITQTLTGLFDFTEAELAQNQAGIISARQQRKLRRSLIYGTFAFPLILAGTWGALYVATYDGKLLGTLFLAGALILALFILYKNIAGFTQAWKDQEIEIISGKVFNRRRIGSSPGTLPEFSMRVGQRRLLPTRAVADFPDPDSIYRFYLLKGSNRILAVELIAPSSKPYR